MQLEIGKLEIGRLDRNVGECVYYPMVLSRMPVRSAIIEQAREVFAAHKGMLRTSEALRLGVHPRTLYALRDSGDLEQVERGLYRLSEHPPLVNPDWVSVAIRVPKSVICLVSALAHHRLTTQVPHAVDIALPSHFRVPQLESIPVRVFWFSEPAFSSGVDTVAIDRVQVRLYSPEKTLADCFKYRNKIGLDVAVEALRLYREQVRRPNAHLLLKYGQICRVDKIMRPYIEAIL